MPRSSKRLPENSFYRDLGRNLRVARIASGKNQSQIAEHLDVSFQQVQKYENGKDRITIHRLISLAAYLEVPLLQLIAPSDSDSKFQSLVAQFGAKEFHRFMEALGSIKDRQAKARLLSLIERMADLEC